MLPDLPRPMCRRHVIESVYLSIDQPCGRPRGEPRPAEQPPTRSPRWAATVALIYPLPLPNQIGAWSAARPLCWLRGLHFMHEKWRHIRRIRRGGVPHGKLQKIKASLVSLTGSPPAGTESSQRQNWILSCASVPTSRAPRPVAISRDVSALVACGAADTRTSRLAPLDAPAGTATSANERAMALAIRPGRRPT